MGIADELESERVHVARTYERIDRMRAQAEDRARAAVRGTGGPPAATLDREAAVGAHGARAGELAIGDRSICFGRIDTDDGDSFHIGRLAVADDDGEPLLVDWRAPVAESFYRATANDRRGVTRRRHIRMRGRDVVAIDDDLLDASHLDDDAPTLVGEAALMAAVSAPRTGRMGDIVATIQAEQDRAIRSPLKGVLVIEGGPGTGKTAVALHRAAFLVYAHRVPLATQGVLVVGPNPVFSRYVENVLPGLGETGIRITTPAELVEGYEVTAEDPPAVGAAKGDAAMLDRLHDALWGRCRPLAADREVAHGASILTVTPEQSVEILAAAEGTTTYDAGRVEVRRALVKHLVLEARRKAQQRKRVIDLHDAVDRLGASADTAAVLEELWPKRSPADAVVAALEAAGLPKGDGWSEHDIALLDEATTLLGTVARRRAARPKAQRLDPVLERTIADMGIMPECPACRSELSYEGTQWVCDTCDAVWRSTQVLRDEQRLLFDEVIARVSATYADAPKEAPRTTWGHVLVDEAQNLTALQWRILRRRCPTGSFTIVGDRHQSVTGTTEHWEAIASHAAPDATVAVLQLDVNYRTPREIMQVAAAVLCDAFPDARPPRSVRDAGEGPVLVRVDAADRLARARELAAAEAAALPYGKVALVLPNGTVPRAVPSVLDRAVAELTVEDARGLEFDSVVVVEPADFPATDLYVALTRATMRLTVVHTADLPAAFTAS